MSPSRWALVMLPFVAVACAKIIGADFDDLRPVDPSSGAGGTTQTTTGAAGQGGQATGGDGGQGGSGGSQGGTGGANTGGAAGTRDGGTDALVDRAEPGDGRVDAPPDHALDSPTDAPKDQGPFDVLAEDGKPDTSPSDGSPIGPIVINELNGQGSLQDYIELFNTGTTSFDLSGYSITQGVGPTGPADVTKGLVFPAGTSLDAGGYLLVVANQPSRDGPHAHCNVVPGFPDIVCYFVDWGISKTNGDSVYLLAPNSTTFDTAMFPPVGPAQPPDGRSYGRYPDGAGAFQPTMWTPGASNRLQ